MTLSELAEAAGLSEVTVRHYEMAGLLRPVVHGSRPLYDTQAGLRLDVIAKARKLGFSLSDTKSILDAHSTLEKRGASIVDLCPENHCGDRAP